MRKPDKLSRKLGARAIFPKSKHSLQILLLILVIAGAVGIALIVGETKPKQSPQSNAETSACGPYRNDTSVQVNGAVFKTEVAKGQSEYTKGLGGRPCILPNQAMLFAFSREGQYRFWMKDMNFPIDMVWVNASHKVAALEIEVEPSTYNSPNPFFENDPAHPAQYVLELKANQAKALHMGLGTPVSF